MSDEQDLAIFKAEKDLEERLSTKVLLKNIYRQSVATIKKKCHMSSGCNQNARDAGKCQFSSDDK